MPHIDRHRGSNGSGGGKSVVLAGVTGVRNRGVQALVDTTLDQLESHWPGVKRSVLSGDAGYDRAALPCDVDVVNDGGRLFGLRKELRVPLSTALQARALVRGRTGAMLEARKAIKEADVVIMSGGDIFGSDYGTGFLRQQVATVAFAQSLGKSTVFLAHSIGPFAGAEEAALVRPVLERSSLITVRESLTRSYLTDALGLAPGRVALTADVAFLLEPSDGKRVDAIQAMIGLPPGAEFVALAPSEGITSFSAMRDVEAHDGAWMRTINAILRTTRYSVLLVPHVQDHRPENDDSRIAFRLMEQLGFDPRVRAAIGPYSARDYKALIARSRFLVGERMHACIAALSSRVPAVTIGYSVKARGVVGEIFGTEADGMVVPVTKFITPGVIEAVIARLDADLDAAKLTLDKTIPTMIERARANFTLMAPLFQDQSAAAG